jgi:hypothetical protein
MDGPERYTDALRITVSASAAPYGYTLTIWTSGAVLGHARGAPTTADAFLYMAGAVVAFAAVALAAFRGLRARVPSQPRAFSLWEATHFFSIAAAIGVATLVAHLFANLAAWGVDGFLATAIYLTGTAAQMRLSRRLRPDEGETRGGSGGRG